MVFTAPIALSCAPTGNVNYNIPNHCDAILGYKFDSSAPNLMDSSVTNPVLNNGQVYSSLTNPHTGTTSNGVWASVGSQDTMSLSFATTQSIDLEGIQLNGYWSTEPTGSAAWDRIQGKLYVNGILVASTGTSNTSAFRGYKGNTTTGANSNDYWEFATSSVHTSTSGTYSVNSGDTVRIDLMSTSTVGSSGNILAIDSLIVHGCAVPEPSSIMLTGLAAFGFTLRRRRT